MFSTPEMAEAVSGRSWVRAMLRVEVTLARAQARAGVIPLDAAEEIAALCGQAEFDITEIGRGAASSASPVVPVVEMLRAKLGPDAAPHVHRGATSQDIIDTAMMLIARDALDLLLGTVERVEGGCARLARAHRDTVMAGRTLMQQAETITFGLKAARWLSGTMEARSLLARYREERLALQLGGAAGILAGVGLSAPQIARDMAAELGLHEPPLPWHTDRTRVAELGSALGILAGAAGKVALDIVLLAQDEVGEVREGGEGGRSSAMPHKRNPAGSVQVLACVRRAQALVPVLLGAMVQEHERAAGGWQAEWETLGDLFSLTHAAVSHLAGVLESLEVNVEAMRANAASLAAQDVGSSSLLIDRVLAAYEQSRQGGQ
jgi:3-carboxy-cis,cis-muconate cycloisomerase